MYTYKELSISLLNEMLTTYESTRAFASYKLNYITPCCPNSIKEIEEFTKMRDIANLKISRLSSCITWLSHIEIESEET